MSMCDFCQCTRFCDECQERECERKECEAREQQPNTGTTHIGLHARARQYNAARSAERLGCVSASIADFRASEEWAPDF